VGNAYGSLFFPPPPFSLLPLLLVFFSRLYSPRVRRQGEVGRHLTPPFFFPLFLEPFFFLPFPALLIVAMNEHQCDGTIIMILFPPFFFLFYSGLLPVQMEEEIMMLVLDLSLPSLFFAFSPSLKRPKTTDERKEGPATYDGSPSFPSFFFSPLFLVLGSPFFFFSFPSFLGRHLIEKEIRKKIL